MKNIFLIPTDKPSRFSLNSSGKYHLTNQLHTNSPNFTNQHIYITDDSEIKDRDYVLSDTSVSVLYLDGEINTTSMLAEGEWEKIILTTDETLIADGVQSISEDFLQWFIKNQSCESIETMFACRGFNGTI